LLIIPPSVDALYHRSCVGHGIGFSPMGHCGTWYAGDIYLPWSDQVM
jgi:hypothetical protein